MDPATWAAIERAVASGIKEANASAVPYPWVAAVCSFFVLLLGLLGKAYLAKDAALQASNAERLEEQKVMAVTLDRATEALSLERRRAA